MKTSDSLPVGVLFPMEFEAEVIWKKIQGQTKTENGFLTKTGTWEGSSVISARIGMGHPGLAGKLETWLQAHPCRAVLLAGLAGALDPAWDEGDLTSFQPESWSEFYQWNQTRKDVRAGKWHTAHEIIATGQAKLALGRKTGCGIVEMEWEYVAEACEKLRIPLVGLRAVSDHADKLLPADLFLLGCDRETGKSTPLKIGLHLALRPWRLIELMPAVAGCTHARGVMSNAVADFLDCTAGNSKS
jgi:nucleoside phosphorylase